MVSYALRADAFCHHQTLLNGDNYHLMLQISTEDIPSIPFDVTLARRTLPFDVIADYRLMLSKLPSDVIGCAP